MKLTTMARSSDCLARAGCFETTHGSVATPVFMPVGTHASVKAMPPHDLKEIGVQVVLANTYHLYLRPGDELIRSLGGLGAFMGWPGPTLTDSGGFQVFSLSDLFSLDEDGITFRSHLDGSEHRLTPEKAVRIQENLGADIIMCLDQCPPYPADEAVLTDALRRTTSWAKRCQAAKTRTDQALFAIIQGGVDLDKRQQHCDELIELGFDGYALGGLSVGEPFAEMVRVVRAIAPGMPKEKPRYLMGVGSPDVLIESVRFGMDMFDSVYPTRMARHGSVMTHRGVLNMRNAQFASDSKPLDPDCSCPVCRRFSRAYVRHLVKSGELLAHYLTTYHNIHFLTELMAQMRDAIFDDRFMKWRTAFWRQYYDTAPPDDLDLPPSRG